MKATAVYHQKNSLFYFSRVPFFTVFLGFLFVFCVKVGFCAGISVIGELKREATLEPGAKTAGKIIVCNNSDKPQQVKVYQTDYLFWADGRNEYGEPGNTPRSNAKWIKVTPLQITVPPKSTESIYYTIEVPQDENLCGTYWSMLMVEPIPEKMLKPPNPEEDKVTVGIYTVLRYGIQLVTHIGKTGTREIKFVDKQILEKEGKKTFSLDIENTGERALAPLLWAELYDQQGILVGRFEAGRMGIYPGCSARFRIDLSGLPAGRYKAIVVADCGDENVFGAQYDLEF